MFKFVKTLFLVGAVVLFVFACRHQHNVLCAEYNGTLPAASSVGIDTTITFLPDGRYQETDVYLGEKDGTFSQSGHYVIKNNMITLVSDNAEESFYQLENKQIRMLDGSRKAVTGSLADFYLLKCTKY